MFTWWKLLNMTSGISWKISSFSYHVLFMTHDVISAPEINISPVLDIVSGSRLFVSVTRNSCWSSVYNVLLKLWPAENESCRSQMQSCRTVTDDWHYFIHCLIPYFQIWISPFTIYPTTAYLDLSLLDFQKIPSTIKKLFISHRSVHFVLLSYSV